MSAKRNAATTDDEPAKPITRPALTVLPVARFVKSQCGHCFHYTPFSNKATGVCNRYPPQATAGEDLRHKVGQPQVGYTTRSCGEFSPLEQGEPKQ